MADTRDRDVLLRQGASSVLADLSPSDMETLALLAEGLSNEAICARLFLCARAVEKRTQRLYLNLGLYPPRSDQNRRVLAVLRYLEATRV